MKPVSLLLILLLNACAQPSVMRGSGVPTDPPIGYTIGCINNPQAVACKESK